jgi:hypothetical protein
MKSNATIAFYLTLVFAAGISVGAFGHRLYTANSVTASAPERRQTPEEYRRTYLAEARTRLQLDEKQATEIAAILEKTGQRYREFRERTRPEMDQIQTDQINSIRAVLNEKQKAEYELWRAERDARRRAGGSR